MAPHLHKLSLLEEPPYQHHHRLVCNLCQEYGNEPVFHCSQCDFDLHPSCAATWNVQDHITHSQHTLHRCNTTDDNHTCGSCGLNVYGITYRCELCNFNIHPTCARAPRFIVLKHQIHEHPLVLTRFPNDTVLHCEACKLRLHHHCYTCTVCPAYHFHQFCATMSTEISSHPDHSTHPLSLVTSFPIEGLTPRCWCMRCRLKVLGCHFHCQDCNFSLHPGCTNIVHEIPEYSSSNTAPTHSTILHLAGADQRNVTTSLSTQNITNTSLSTVTTHGTMPLPINLHNNLSEGLPYVPSDSDVDVAENVLRFARALRVSIPILENNTTSQGHGAHADDEFNLCPTCLDGFSEQNPKKSTSCGHHFHLDCILDWMDRSPLCPICRSEVRIHL